MAKYPDIIETLCLRLGISAENIVRQAMNEEEIKVSLTKDYRYAQEHEIKETRLKLLEMKKGGNYYELEK